MRRGNTKRPWLGLAALVLMPLATAQATAQAMAQAMAQAPALPGHWVSVAPEAAGPLFATREFDIGERDWSVVYRAYADARATQPLFTLHVGGRYVLGGPSGTVAGAYEGVFPADHRHITADSPAGVQMFAAMGCALVQGREQALLSEGCGFVPGLMQAMGEYDLVAIRDDRLFFGDRAGDLTKTRPAALTPHPLVRR